MTKALRTRTPVLLAALLLAASVHSLAQTDSAETGRAHQLVGLFLGKGQRQAYEGEQVTRLLRGRVRETRQIVKHAGPGRMRMEYVFPPNLAGETILIVGGRYFHYKPPPENRILEGVAPPGELAARAKELTQRLRRGAIQARVVGQEEVASRDAAIVEIRSLRGGAFYLKFWIDTATGVRLKYNNLDPAGRVVSETYFTKIDFNPQFSDSAFRPGSLPDVPHEALLPKGKPYASVSAAQPYAPYPIREPSVPEGYRLDGVWVVRGPNRITVILRYTDGVNSFALFESPAPGRRAVKWRPGLMRNGVAQWADEGMAFVLIGNLKTESARTIVDSL
jgi:outer membrane lipoprotein-sorting protein